MSVEFMESAESSVAQSGHKSEEEVVAEFVKAHGEKPVYAITQFEGHQGMLTAFLKSRVGYFLRLEHFDTGNNFIKMSLTKVVDEAGAVEWHKQIYSENAPRDLLARTITSDN